LWEAQYSYEHTVGQPHRKVQTHMAGGPLAQTSVLSPLSQGRVADPPAGLVIAATSGTNRLSACNVQRRWGRAAAGVRASPKLPRRFFNDRHRGHWQGLARRSRRVASRAAAAAAHATREAEAARRPSPACCPPDEALPGDAVAAPGNGDCDCAGGTSDAHGAVGTASMHTRIFTAARESVGHASISFCVS